MTQNNAQCQGQECQNRQRLKELRTGGAPAQTFEDEMYSKHLTDNLRSDWPTVPYQCRISSAL